MDDRVEIAAISDVSEERLAVIGDRYDVPGFARFSDYEAMLETSELDFVHVCTPHHLHESQAIAAMEAGAHVLLEKPIATSLEEADRIIRGAQRLDRRLTVSHNQLFRPQHRAVQDLLRSDAVGDLFLIRSEGLSPKHVTGRGVDQDWRTSAVAGGGGPLIDNGYHQIYCAVDFIRSPAKRVYARIGRYVQQIDVEDTALLLIEHENDGTTSKQVGWSAPAGGIRVEELYGTRGQVRLGGENPVSVWQQDTGAWNKIDIGPEGKDEFGFQDLAAAFVNSLSDGNSSVPVDPGAARHVLSIVRAAYESGESGLPVDVT